MTASKEGGDLSTEQTSTYNVSRSFETGPLPSPKEEEWVPLRPLEDGTGALGVELRELLQNFTDSSNSEGSLADLVERHGITPVLRMGFTLWPKQFRNHLARQARLLTERREKINQATFYKAAFGLMPGNYRCGKKAGQVSEYKKFTGYLYDIIGEEEKWQQLVLPRSNAEAMRMDTDRWKVFWVKAEGTSLQSAEFDFSVIKNAHFKAAFKYWLIKKRWRNKTSSFRGATFTGMVSRAFNFLSESAGVVTPSAVTVTHVRRLIQYLCCDARSYKDDSLAMAGVRGHFKILNQMFDWLQRTSVAVPDGQPPVLKNAFRAVSFKNEREHTDTAEYMPEEVVNQLLLHRVELPDDVNRCFTVMMELGLRYLDAVMLEEGCLEHDDDLGMHVLKYVPQKTKNHRMKRRLDPYHSVGVNDIDTVRAIVDQERASAPLRAQTGTKLIFVKKPSDQSYKVNVLSASGFTNAIRLLISKHNITDHDGNLWDFNSHQCRKTVAVIMVDNKAHPVEIRQFLGHLDQRTTDGVYAEVRKLRQGELNHEFFEKKFHAKVPQEQLGKFTEEERRILYTEFALGQRDVELGRCVKHASEGPCGKRSGETNCATCKNLCTGPQFKPKWLNLVESKEREITELEAAYARADIPELEYQQYREYQKAQKLLKEYSAALAGIESHGA